MSLLRLLELEDRGGSAHGALDGTTPVEIVPAPDTGITRIVESIRFVNIDSAPVDIMVRKTVGASDYDFDRAMALAADGKFFPVEGADTIRLTDTDQSITAVMGGSAASDDPTWVASWRDVLVAE